MRWPISRKFFSQLKRETTAPDGRVPEILPHYLYDTRTYTDNSTTQLVFFQTTQTDRTLSNMKAAGQLPSPNYMQIHYICLDFWTAAMVSTSAGGVAGSLNDLAFLMYVGRPVLQLNVGDKPYGPWPALACSGLGGFSGFTAGTWTAEENLSWALNPPGDGLYVGGAITLAPKESFDVTIDFQAAQDLTADWRVRCTLVGTYYRQVR